VKKGLSSRLELPVSLDWLINPIPKAVFFKEYWEQKPLVVRRGQKDYFSSLLSLDDVDRAITTLNLTYPNITLKNAVKDVTPADYTPKMARWMPQPSINSSKKAPP